jgi:hypothetical protein
MKTNKIKCDQCSASIVSGVLAGKSYKNVFVHEAGCPNSNKKYDRENDRWLTMVSCPICGYDRPVDEVCCED